MDTSFDQYLSLWNKCHCPKDFHADREVVMRWVARMEDMLGPDTCKGFIIRSNQHHLKGFFLSDRTYEYVPTIAAATLFNWGDTAVKITNNRKLEAIRVDRDGVAVDSKGRVTGVINFEDNGYCGE